MDTPLPKAQCRYPAGDLNREAAMDSFVHRQNLKNFRKQLAVTKDEKQRIVLAKLLAEEEAKERKPSSDE